MAYPKLTAEICQATVDLVAKLGTVAAAARAWQNPDGTIGISRGTMDARFLEAKKRGFRAQVGPDPRPPMSSPAPANETGLEDLVFAALRKAPATLVELAERVNASKGTALDAIEALQARGSHVVLMGERYTISPSPEPAFMRAGSPADLPTYYSRPDGTYLFGACGDNHLGSKYARLDVLNALYDWYAEEGVDRVYNTGNWIDGEASFNTHDLLVHGMDAQLRYLAEHYPKRDGIDTYAVAGDDHEGWYAKKFGVDIGMRAQHTMRDAGRTDWHNLFYMEAHIRLVHSQSGAEAILAVVHPGGGSAYAVSYAIQKIVESLDGGEKPAVGLYGHYHKLWAGNIRNVWVMQTGTTEDQTTFMRKKKLEAHVGGGLVKLTQDPRSGAIIGFRPEFRRYFNKGFYNDRWSNAGPVVQAERGP